MVGRGDVLLDLIEVVGGRHVHGVLLSVQGVQLQGVVDLAEAHGSGVGAAGGEELNIQGVAGGTQDHALQVGGGVDGLLAVGHLAEGAGPTAQAGDTHALYAVEQVLTDVAVQVVLQLLGVIKQIGDGDHIEAGVEAGVQGGGQDHDVQRTVAHRGDRGIAVSAVQRAVGVDGQLDAAVGVLLHTGLELLGRGIDVGVVGIRHADVHGNLGIRGITRSTARGAGRASRSAGAADQREGQRQSQDRAETLFHLKLLLFDRFMFRLHD